ncbi:hypothetical protein Vafri_8395 [Volvox africanus]|nr:hypothetical protein Vafri_8395 [Volvox africanus]
MTEVLSIFLGPSYKLQVFSFCASPMGLSPNCLQHLAISVVVMSVLIWLSFVFRSSMTRVQVIAAVAAAVMFPKLARALTTKLCSLSFWWQPNLRHSRWMQPTPEAPEAVQAILKLTRNGHVDCTQGENHASASHAPSVDGISRTSPSSIATAGAGVDLPKSGYPLASARANRYPEGRTAGTFLQNSAAAIATYASRPEPKSWNEFGSKSTPLQASYRTSTTPFSTPAEAARSKAPGSARVFEARVSGSSLKAPVGLSRCTIVEDAPFPPPNTQVVMELHEKTLRVGGRRLRYRGYRPADRTLPLLLQAPVGTPGLFTAGQSPFVDARAGRSGQYCHSQTQNLLAYGPGATRNTSNPPYSPSQSGPHQPDVMFASHAPNVAVMATGTGPRTPAATVARSSRPSPASPHLMAPYPAGATATLSHVDSYQPTIHMHLQNNHNRHNNYNYQDSRHSLSLSIKVPWAQPSDLPAGGGGLLESLNEALATGSGYMVVGATVRPGCILLQMDLMATNEAGADLLRGFGGVAREVRSRRGRDGAIAFGGGSGGGGGSALAAQLAYQVGLVAPTPPDGSEVLVSLGGHLSYSFTYDAAAAAWTATQLTSDSGVSGAEGIGAHTTRMHRLQVPYGIRLRPTRAALAVPAAAEVKSPPMLLVSLQLEVSEEEVATELAGQLRPLLHSASALQPQPQPRHDSLEGWQLVANCTGRSLPVCVLRVVGPSRGEDSTADFAHQASAPTAMVVEQNAAAATTATTAGKSDVDVASAATAAATMCPTAGISTTRAAGTADSAVAGARPVVYVDAGVLGTREAVESASCRMAVLSVELWCGMQEVAQVPIMLVHQSELLPYPAGPCQRSSATRNAAGDAEACQAGGVAALNAREECALAIPSGCPVLETPADIAPGTSTADDAVAAIVEELNGLATAAGFAGTFPSSLEEQQKEKEEEEEEEHCIRQMFTDLGVLELFAASQVRRTEPAIQDQKIGGGGAIDAAAGGDWAHLCSSWSSEVDVNSFTAADAVDPEGLPPPQPPQPPPQQQQGPEEEAGGQVKRTPKAAAALLLSGSLDMSCPLQQLLGRPDPQQRQSMLLIGANLLSYTILHGMPHTANAIRKMLAVLGCGLAEADALSAAAAGVSEEDVFGGELLPAGGGTAPNDHLCTAPEWDDSSKNGLPLTHLAVLSGNINVVRMVLKWAEEEGLGSEWVMRRHRGPLPLQLAMTAANPDTAGRDDGGAGGHVEYLALLTQLLSPQGAVPHSQQDSDAGGSAGTAEDRVSELRVNKDLAVLAVAMTAYPHASSCSDGISDVGKPSDGGGGGKAIHAYGSGSSAAYTSTSHVTNTRGTRNGSNLQGWHRQRHPLLVCLLGYSDPATEAQYQQFVVPYDVHVASYWIPLMCFLLACALLRLILRGRSGADLSEAPAAVLFAWPYVVLAVCLKLRP